MKSKRDFAAARLIDLIHTIEIGLRGYAALNADAGPRRINLSEFCKEHLGEKCLIHGSGKLFSCHSSIDAMVDLGIASVVDDTLIRDILEPYRVIAEVIRKIKAEMTMLGQDMRDGLHKQYIEQ